MSDQSRLFDEFTPASHQAWLEKIRADLKNRSVDELHWQIEEGLEIDPFSTPEERYVPPPIGTSNQWSICEEIPVGHSKEGNPRALEALSGGANALRFVLAPDFRVDELPLLLRDIALNMITVHWEGEGFRQNPEGVITAVEQLAGQRKYRPEELKGSIALDPAMAESGRWWFNLTSRLPRFALFLVKEKPAEQTSEALAGLLTTAVEAIRELDLSARQMPLSNYFRFSFSMGNSFFLNVAKLRAFRLLWAHVMQAYGQPIDQLPGLTVDIRLDDPKLDFNTQLIYATTRGMAAVFGYTDELSIVPLPGQAPSFANRICRNIQHLMQMESHLDQVIDPAGGSYFIEQLTYKLAQKAWTRFQVQK